MSASPPKEDSQAQTEETPQQQEPESSTANESDNHEPPPESDPHQGEADAEHHSPTNQQSDDHNAVLGDLPSQTDGREYSPGDDDIDIKEQDRFLPIANVARIMKKALPDNAKIAKEAKECVQECVSEFISFITSEASEKCQMEKRKTINGEDILYAMASLGFDNYAEALKIYLAKYRETTKIERASAINKDKEDGEEGDAPAEGFQAQTDPNQFAYPMQAYQEQPQ